MDYAERRMRAELSAFPDGNYGFDDVIENDGIEAKPYTVAVDLYIQGDEMVADYSRSSPRRAARSTPPSASPPVPSTTACCT